jgi:hypothetical protein
MTDSKTEAPAPRVSALNVTDHPDKGSQVGVIAKRTYLVRGGRCVVADQQVALVEEPQTTQDGAELLHDLDIVLNRRNTDVIILGKAHPLHKARSFEICVRIGGLDRRLLAFGDRRCWRDQAGRLRFSEPEPVEEFDLGWTSAYGGVDVSALKAHGDPIEAMMKDAGQPYEPKFGLYAYPRNRVGKGYLIEATDEALSACALPNIERRSQRLTPERLAQGKRDRWPHGPIVAGLGWLSYGSFPRMAMLGMPPPYDPVACPPEGFREVEVGLLKAKSIAPATPLQDRFDLGAAQESAVGMRVAEIKPGASAELQNCHPQHSVWAFELPREVPSLALQLPEQKPVALEPKIRTVLIQPELNRICIVWVAEHREPTPIGPGKRAQIKHGVKWHG